MSSNLVRRGLNSIARWYRGASYQLDAAVPLSSLVGFSLRRGWALGRCLILLIEWHPSRLVFVGANVTLRNRRLIQFGRGVTLGNGVLIDGLSQEGVVIGDKVSIGAHSIIEATGVISNLGKGLVIGQNSGIGAFSFIGAAGGVSIGSNVIMGQYVSFHSENHVFVDTEVPIRLQGITRKGISIDDDCWVGAKVTFLDGSHVGAGCVIAAGSVVRGEIPPFSIVAGVPAKVIRSRKAAHSQ